MIGVIDYGMGNLRSVLNAIERIGCDGEIVDRPDSLRDCERLILPGVGAYGCAMDNLRAKGFPQAIKDYVDIGRPLLGICLGMQLLSTTGDEPYRSDGLDLISGRVVRLPVSETIPLPHVGWNNIRLARKHPVFENIRSDVDYYFVHSYCFQPDDDDAVLGVTDYEIPFVSVVAHGNVLGFQFHPEKSQAFGLHLFENFCRWNGRC